MTTSNATCFSPVANVSTRVLLLGSLPGEESLKREQYYAHPRNQFWRLIGDLIETDLIALEYTQRLECLLSNGIGLWDVITTAVRTGSLDQNIRDPVLNSLEDFICGLPAIRVVAFNGTMAYRLGKMRLMEIPSILSGDIDMIGLPSSSPANTMRFQDKLAAWGSLTSYLR